MAKKNNKSGKFEEYFKDVFRDKGLYESMSSNEYKPDYSYRAAQIANEYGDSVAVKVLQGSTNLQELKPIIRRGFRDSIKKFRDYGSDNLEEILDSTNENNLKNAIPYGNYNISEEIPDEFKEIYNSISIAKLLENLEMNQKNNKNTQQSYDIKTRLKSIVASKIYDTYKEDPELTELFTSLAMSNNQYLELKAMEIKETATEKYETEKLKEFVKTYLDKENPGMFYEGLLLPRENLENLYSSLNPQTST